MSAQLLSFFKSDDSFGTRHSQQGARDFLVAACYLALFLNISATISSFILIDILGEIGFKASTNEDALRKLGNCRTTQDKLLLKFGASPWWRIILWHCKSNHLWLEDYYCSLTRPMQLNRARYFLSRNIIPHYFGARLRMDARNEVDPGCNDSRRYPYIASNHLFYFLQRVCC